MGVEKSLRGPGDSCRMPRFWRLPTLKTRCKMERFGSGGPGTRIVAQIRRGSSPLLGTNYLTTLRPTTDPAKPHQIKICSLV